MEEKKRAAVFMDLNNVEESIKDYRESGMYLDYSHLVREMTEGYDVVSVKVYDSIPAPENTELMNLHDRLTGANFDLITKRPAPLQNNMTHTCTQKEVDTSLVVDVVSMAYQDLYDVAIIVSGDRDMRPAGECVETMLGKQVVYASFYDVMCPELRDHDGSVILDDLYVLEATDYSVRFGTESIASFPIDMKGDVANEA